MRSEELIIFYIFIIPILTFFTIIIRSFEILKDSNFWKLYLRHLILAYIVATIFLMLGII